MPANFSSTTSLQMTIAKSEYGAALIKCLIPFKMYPSPSFTAVVWIALASEPAPGSVKAKQQLVSL